MMKTTLLRTLALALTALLCLTLCACGDKISRDEAEAHIEGYLAAVSAGELEKAADYYHPDRPFDTAKLLAGIEAEHAVSFAEGVTVERYRSSESSVYSGERAGARYELEVVTLVGTRTLVLEVEVVRNDGGFGIWEIDVED